jgi:hypothetical protein
MAQIAFLIHELGCCSISQAVARGRLSVPEKQRETKRGRRFRERSRREIGNRQPDNSDQAADVNSRAPTGLNAEIQTRHQ